MAHYKLGGGTSPWLGENNQTYINHNVQQQLFAQDGVGDLDAYVPRVIFCRRISTWCWIF